MQENSAPESGRRMFEKYRVVFNAMTRIIAVLPRPLQQVLFDHIVYLNGKIAIGLRYCLLRVLSKKCGSNVAVFSGVQIKNLRNLSVGSNVSIHSMSYIECLGGCTISDDVSIAHGVTIMTTEHNYADLDVPIKYQGIQHKPVNIDRDVWIGAKAVILGGVQIGCGSIVAACALVKKPVAPYSVVAGVPAKQIRSRLDAQ